MTQPVTKVLQEPVTVDHRLAEIGMSRGAILAIRDTACSMGATGASPFFPANGAGQLAYQYGTRELRAQFHELGWEIDQTFGTQGVRLPGEKRVAIYQNVDVACSLVDLPNPRSRKGAGSERLSQMSAFEVIEEEVPSTFRAEAAAAAVWYVMVAEDGAVEVTNAVVRNGKFADLVERIWVDDGEGFDVAGEQERGDDAVDFDVVVTRK